MSKSLNMYKKAKRIIPGATQLLSKRQEMQLPGLWPSYYKKAKGCKVWDLDGKQYTDMSFMGIGSCILGYGDRDIDGAVKTAINSGSMSTLNCPEDIELAMLMCKLHPWAKMARFARTGGEAMAIAVRIARAFKRKDIILFCGYHGWHDWYISANLSHKKSLDGHLLPGLGTDGVPRCLRGTAYPFSYNDTEMFLKLVNRYKGRIGAVVMEPIRNQYPKKGFLEIIRKVTSKHNIPLIFDEITSGWRMCTGGSHLKFKIYPDIAVFGKAISNGYPMAVIIGRRKIMEAAQKTFISSTYWTEKVGPVAAIATIKKIKSLNVSAYLNKIGKEIQGGWGFSARRHNLNISVSGIYPLGHFVFNHEKPLVLKTLFTQLMLERGYLATTSFYASFAHKDKDIKGYLKAADRSFSLISGYIEKDLADKHLKDKVCHSGFRRLA